MQRYDIINELILKNGFTKYLEIGVREPNDCFNLININTKHSVDPCFEVDAQIDYKQTSDQFFRSLRDSELNLDPNYKWDIIFIDGLHESDQVERDIENSLAHLSPNGYIVLHDCNPPTIHHAREDFYDHSTPAEGNWNGTVWKAIYKYRATRPDLEIFTIDTDWGVGIIKHGFQECCDFDNPYYEYNKFNNERGLYLNLISVDEFLKNKL